MASRPQLIPTSQFDLERIRADVIELSGIERRTGTEGERRSAEWARGRLEELGAENVSLLPFRTQTTWAWAHVAHYVLGLAAAAIGGRLGIAGALATAYSFEADNTGRNQWLRRLLPAYEGTNVIATLPSSGLARRTLVLVAHHDAAHTGWVWNRKMLESGRKRAVRTGNVLPFNTLPLLGMAAAAVPTRATRALGAAIMLTGAGLSLQAAMAQTVPGANDNATGLAVLLELARQIAEKPLPGVEVILVVPGGEEASMVGMRAWMRAEGRQLDRSSTLFLGLDALGAGQCVVAAREGWTARYHEEDFKWADLAAERAGVEAARFGLGTSTDVMMAHHHGYPAVSILSQRDGLLGQFHLPEDRVERVDWNSVEDCARLARGVIDSWVEA